MADSSVAAVVVTHGPDPDLEDGLDALAAQVDELVVVANIPGHPERVGHDATLIENDRPRGFSANVNQGVAATKASWIVVANPDTIASPGVVRRLVEFGEADDNRGVIAPQLVYPDGRWQPSRRRFPTVWGTLVRRTPLRLVLDPEEFSRAHYQLDERPTDPVESDWMLGAFLALRRSMFDELGGFDEGYRLYGEDIDFCYRAARTGWERWYVPSAVVQHRLGELTAKRFLTRRTVWHVRGMLHFAREHPERLRAIW